MLVDTHKIIFTVAPLVGAWIEIINSYKQIASPTVAPLVGAWIEIPLIIPTGFSTAVAPLVGAWIEILLLHFMALVSRRRSPRGSVD